MIFPYCFSTWSSIDTCPSPTARPSIKARRTQARLSPPSGADSSLQLTLVWFSALVFSTIMLLLSLTCPYAHASLTMPATAAATSSCRQPPKSVLLFETRIVSVLQVTRVPVCLYTLVTHHTCADLLITKSQVTCMLPCLCTSYDKWHMFVYSMEHLWTCLYIQWNICEHHGTGVSVQE